MPRYAAFLRGMNLGRRRISNADLRAHVEALGFDGVATFRASGNVIVETARREAAAKLAQRIESGLQQALGYDVPVFARSEQQMRAIAAAEPFDADALSASKGKPQVVLLSAAPSAAARRAAQALAPDDDRLVFEAGDLHWLPGTGLADAEMDLKALAKALGGPVTVRTKGTIDLIVAKFFSQ